MDRLMSLYKITDRYSSGNPKIFSCKFCGESCYKADTYFEDRAIDTHLKDKHLNEIDSKYKCKKCPFFGLTLKEASAHRKDCKEST